MSGDFRFRSLFLSDLSADVTEVTLLNAFCSSGPIASVHIVRDRHTRQSLGKGYVNFVNERDARQALKEKNFIEINGKQIRVMAAQSDPNLRKQNHTNVFVKNLDKSVDNKRLYEIFSRFGVIMSCKLAEEVNGQSKGFGFVQFESEQNAIDAIIGLNGRQLNGKTLFCSKFMPKSMRQKYIISINNINNEIKSYANIYVKNLSPEFNDNILKQLFSTFGSIIAIKVFHKQSKHFGFISFEDSVIANTAVKTLNGKTLANGSALYVSRALKMTRYKGSKNRLIHKCFDGTNIYVKYLDESIDSNKLMEIFCRFGQITTARAYSVANSRHSFNGFGFVCFTTQESAQKAVQQMNNSIIGNKSLFVSIAQPFSRLNKRLLSNQTHKPKGMSTQLNGYRAVIHSN